MTRRNKVVSMGWLKNRNWIALGLFLLPLFPASGFARTFPEMLCQLMLQDLDHADAVLKFSPKVGSLDEANALARAAQEQGVPAQVHGWNEAQPKTGSIRVRVAGFAALRRLTRIVSGQIDQWGVAVQVNAPATARRYVTEFLSYRYRHLTPSAADEVELFLEDRVFSDPEFHRDPQEYLEFWRRTRARKPSSQGIESIAFEFMENMARERHLADFTDHFESSEHLSEANPDALSVQWTTQARVEFGRIWNHELDRYQVRSGLKDKRDLYDFLHEWVLPHPEFQSNPREFIRRWAEAGGSERDWYIKRHAYLFLVSFQGIEDLPQLFRDGDYPQRSDLPYLWMN